MTEAASPAMCQFYRLIRGAPTPQRADRSADGTLPVIAYRYCEAIASASAFGWYLYPPISFALAWDGDEIRWTYEGAESWQPLRGAQYPGFLEQFAETAPASLKTLAPTFLTQGKLPGSVQIWSGYLARTAPGWALLSRGTANIPKTQPYVNYEGIIETDTWFGPLFTNVRLTRTNTPIEFHTRYPLFQVQPLLRQCYREVAFEVLETDSLKPDDWRDFEVTMTPATDQMRLLGHYAVAARKRLRSLDAK